jgi:hypothetical protein
VIAILASETGLEHMEAENFGEVVQSHSKELSNEDWNSTEHKMKTMTMGH